MSLMYCYVELLRKFSLNRHSCDVPTVHSGGVSRGRLRGSVKEGLRERKIYTSEPAAHFWGAIIFFGFQTSKTTKKVQNLTFFA